MWVRIKYNETETKEQIRAILVRMSDIVLIAPYEKMLSDAKHVIEKRHYTNITAVFGDLSAGLIAASDALKNGAKILISRGGT